MLGLYYACESNDLMPYLCYNVHFVCDSPYTWSTMSSSSSGWGWRLRNWPINYSSYIRLWLVNFLSQRHMMLDFLLDCLRFSKLLKLHQTEDRISSNLLKRNNPAGKQVSCAADFTVPSIMLLLIVDMHYGLLPYCRPGFIFQCLNPSLGKIRLNDRRRWWRWIQ